MAPTRSVGPAAAQKSAANKTVPVPRPSKAVVKPIVQASKTSSASETPLAIPERRTPPRPTPSEMNGSKPAPVAVEAKAVQKDEPKKSTALEEMSKRAAAVRGTPATTATADGVAPVVVPRKTASADSPAVKALQAKKEEIAKKIANGSVAAPSKSMAVGVPSRVGTASAPSSTGENIQAPSIKERYATEGSSPISAKTVASAIVPQQPSALPSEAKQAQKAISSALSEASEAMGRALHIHVHAPVYISIGDSKDMKSKL